MSEVPAWAALSWSVVATIGNLVWTERRYRQASESQRALGPNPQELHAVLLTARDLFEQVRDEAGWTRDKFEGQPAGRLHRKLADYADGVANDELRDKAHETADDVEKLSLMAAVDRGDIVGLNRQVEYARDHLSCVLAAIVVFNEISTGTPSALRGD